MFQKLILQQKKLKSWIGFKPKTTIKFGIKKFVEWYVQYYKIKI